MFASKGSAKFGLFISKFGAIRATAFGSIGATAFSAILSDLLEFNIY